MRDGSTDRKGLSQRAQNLTEGQGKNKEDLGRKPGLRSHKGLRSAMLGERDKVEGREGSSDEGGRQRDTERPQGDTETLQHLCLPGASSSPRRPNLILEMRQTELISIFSKDFHLQLCSQSTEP